jgi:5-methylcytosine-specific restriction endonuclease McrA
MCASERANKSRRARKAKCVTALGGKCERCGYDKCQSALEFHHKNPEEKDFAFSESRGFTDEELANELKKCELLCANCHREVHEELGW